MNAKLGARRAGTVRMGPVSIITLVIVLLLSVMAVLAVTTANASWKLAERQAAFTGEDYANEAAAQLVLAGVSEAAQGAGSPEEARRQVAESLPDLARLAGSDRGVTAQLEGSVVTVHVESELGRALDAELRINDDATVSVASWKATTLWDENTGDVLWTGNE